MVLWSGLVFLAFTIISHVVAFAIVAHVVAALVALPLFEGFVGGVAS